MPDLTTEFQLCSRAAALGVPFVPEGWEHLDADDLACVDDTLAPSGGWPVGWYSERSIEGGDLWSPLQPSGTYPIDAASWRDAASELAAQFGLAVYYLPSCEWWFVEQMDEYGDMETVSMEHPTRHAALVAAVTQVIEAKEKE